MAASAWGAPAPGPETKPETEGPAPGSYLEFPVKPTLAPADEQALYDKVREVVERAVRDGLTAALGDCQVGG